MNVVTFSGMDQILSNLMLFNDLIIETENRTCSQFTNGTCPDRFRPLSDQTYFRFPCRHPRFRNSTNLNLVDVFFICRRAGVNFINVFTCSFYACKFRKRKMLLELTVFFALLGSACVKAEYKILVKLTPEGEKDRQILNFG